MLISFAYKKHPLYNSPFREKNITYSCIPIKYKRCSYLLTLFDNLEGVLSDEEVIVFIYVNKKRKIIKTINNIKDLHKNKINENDSFYDSHTSLLFISFQDISIEYIELDSYIISSLLMQDYKNQNVQINYFNNRLDIITNTGIIIDNYNFDLLDTGFILPPIPHLQCLIQSPFENQNLFKGSPVFNTNNHLCGIIRHSQIDNSNMCTIIPTITIIKSLELNKNIYMFNESTIFTNITYDPINEKEKGIYIVKDSNITKKLKKGYVITSINGYSIVTNNTLLINKTKEMVIPINTYIWLLSLEQVTINKVKISNMENILQNYAENDDDSINITIHKNSNKKIINKIKLYNINESLFKAYDATFTKYKGGYVLDVNEHIIKLLKLNLNLNCDNCYNSKNISDSNNILQYLWNNRFNHKVSNKLYFKKNKIQLLST